VKKGESPLEIINRIILTAVQSGVELIHLRPGVDGQTEVSHQTRNGPFIHAGYIPQRWTTTILSRLKVKAGISLATRGRAQRGEVQVMKSSHTAEKQDLPGHEIFIIPHHLGCESAIIQFTPS
jgi:type II secretory ATPase GspE/PulE/Tfp pilus assembly ATPase PilB-like protein